MASSQVEFYPELAACWEFWARDEQLPPDGDWRFWYLRGGRGSGKTRTGAETLASWIFSSPPGSWGIIAPTYADARKVCVEGESGLMQALGSSARRATGPLVENWNRSSGELFLANGARVVVDGADDGAYRIQGENLLGAWCDEVGLWKHGWDTAWNESLFFAVRHDRARIIATGTPKAGHPLVKLLLEDDRTAVTHMSTSDNAANLSPSALADFERRFGGTRRGLQELEGEFLEDVPGALWKLETIDATRIRSEELPRLDRVVVGVDPSGSADEDTGVSETGIVAAGWSRQTGHAYVLGDHSLYGSPDRWASRVFAAYDTHEADLVVAERNFGGEMVRTTLQAHNENMPVKLVSASRGKKVRADPIALLYERGRVHHVGIGLGELERQMCQWVPDSAMASPDRMDAVVWALTELMLGAAEAKHTDAAGGSHQRVYRRGDLVLIGDKYIDRD